MNEGNPLSLEREIKRFLQQKRISFDDHTNAYQKLDFTLWLAHKQPFFLEVKEKRQAYSPQNWPTLIAPEALFILDDLTVRKCLAYAPRAGVLVRDNLLARYHFFSIIDLALMPRQRVNRPIERNQPELKGKWLINLGDGQLATTLEESFAQILAYLADLPLILFDHHPCYGEYHGEEIGNGGIVRNPAHWEQDIKATR